MKRFILFFSLMLSCMTTFAEWVEIDGIVYELDKDYMTAEVTGNTQKYSGDIVIPSTISHDGDYTVASIGYQAFYWCNELTSVTIPYTVTKIGNQAFITWIKSTTGRLLTIPRTQESSLPTNCIYTAKKVAELQNFYGHGKRNIKVRS